MNTHALPERDGTILPEHLEQYFRNSVDLLVAATRATSSPSAQAFFLRTAIEHYHAASRCFLPTSMMQRLYIDLVIAAEGQLHDIDTPLPRVIK